MEATGAAARAGMARKAIRLEWFTIAWNCLEAVIALASGLLAGSIALVGFGFDSCIEVASGSAVLWRMRHDAEEARREGLERASLRMVGACFLALALYMAYESAECLLAGKAPKQSLAGILLAAASLVVMPLLSRAKRRVAGPLGSAALSADARQTDFCAYLSAILLAGLLLNALFGVWWADPLAALVMTPIIAKEGTEALRAKTCCGRRC